MPSSVLAQGLAHLDPWVERRVEIAVPHSSTRLVESHQTVVRQQCEEAAEHAQVEKPEYSG
ncbi:hypothetical protein A6A29_21330 [Streptomyces sp. TSRI0281]|nr:hypothetical protein A6A29_21330 [Streptomyces sp. TSRI0281]